MFPCSRLVPAEPKELRCHVSMVLPVKGSTDTSLRSRVPVSFLSTIQPSSPSPLPRGTSLVSSIYTLHSQDQHTQINTWLQQRPLVGHCWFIALKVHHRVICARLCIVLTNMHVPTSASTEASLFQLNTTKDLWHLIPSLLAKASLLLLRLFNF